MLLILIFLNCLQAHAFIQTILLVSIEIITLLLIIRNKPYVVLSQSRCELITAAGRVAVYFTAWLPTLPSSPISKLSAENLLINLQFLLLVNNITTQLYPIIKPFQTKIMKIVSLVYFKLDKIESLKIFKFCNKVLELFSGDDEEEEAELDGDDDGKKRKRSMKRTLLLSLLLPFDYEINDVCYSKVNREGPHITLPEVEPEKGILSTCYIEFCCCCTWLFNLIKKCCCSSKKNQNQNENENEKSPEKVHQNEIKKQPLPVPTSKVQIGDKGMILGRCHQDHGGYHDDYEDRVLVEFKGGLILALLPEIEISRDVVDKNKGIIYTHVYLY